MSQAQAALSAKQVYSITYLAGKWIAGQRRAAGATTIELTPDEAEYDLRAGTIVALGDPLPAPPISATVDAADVVALVRAGSERSATIADLVAYLVSSGAVASGQRTAINQAMLLLRGTADADHNTLGKIAALVEANRERLDAVLSGANPAIDSFIEVANRILADEDLLASVLAALGVRLVVSKNLSDVGDKATALANLNGLDRRILVLPGDPGPGDIAAGTVRVVKNGTSGRLSLWANDGGTMIDLLLVTPAA